VQSWHGFVMDMGRGHGSTLRWRLWMQDSRSAALSHTGCEVALDGRMLACSGVVFGRHTLKSAKGVHHSASGPCPKAVRDCERALPVGLGGSQ
jgi:hypothetical protein